MGSDELKVLRRLSKGPATSVDRITADALQDRGLVGRVSGVAMTYCITPEGLAALRTCELPAHTWRFSDPEFSNSFAA